VKTAARKPFLETEEAYRHLRRTLIQFFSWRGAADPNELADETIFRIMVNVNAGEEIRDLAAYAYTVARNVLSENLRHERLANTAPFAPEISSTGPDAQLALHCLERCLGDLTASERKLLRAYYHGETGVKITNRRKIAEKLKIDPGALALRVFRVRKKLAACLEACRRQELSR